MPTHVSIDVDQTILDEDGNLILGVVDGLIALQLKGLTLQLWSKGGADYARKVARKYRLQKYFSSYAAKPDLAIDDLPEDARPVSTLDVPFDTAVQSIVGQVADSIETALCPSRTLVKLVWGLQQKRQKFEKDYFPILRRISKDGSIRPHHPIAFFGNLEAARVLTVGLNPSSGEFEPWRKWPVPEMEPELLARRCSSYFRLVDPRPHHWFGELQEALAIIGVSYKVSAAHVDLSPWSTLSPMALKKPGLKQLYNRLLRLGQSRWLPQVLDFCKHSVRLVIILDTYSERVTETEQICRKRLGTEWHGDVVTFKSSTDVPSWAWEHRLVWRDKIGCTFCKS